MKVVDDRLKTLEKDVKEIKEVVLTKSFEHKVGSVLEDLQEKIDALTRLVQSIKSEDYSYEVCIYEILLGLVIYIYIYIYIYIVITERQVWCCYRNPV